MMKNFTKADVTAEFDIAIDGDNDKAVLTAAALYGSGKAYIESMMPRLEWALRDVAARSSDIADFAVRGNNLLGAALGLSAKEHGLKLQRAEIKSVTPAPLSSYNPNNYFDARGMKIAYPDQAGPEVKPA